MRPQAQPMYLGARRSILQCELHVVCCTLHIVCCAQGGGGLLAGVASYVKALRPHVRVIGVEAEDAAGMTLSLQVGLAEQSKPNSPRVRAFARRSIDRLSTSGQPLRRPVAARLCKATRPYARDSRAVCRCTSGMAALHCSAGSGRSSARLGSLPMARRSSLWGARPSESATNSSMR